MVVTTTTTSVFGGKPLMTVGTTTSSVAGLDQATTTSTPAWPAISSVVATSTVTSLTYTAPTTSIQSEQPHDVRVGWIYDLSKQELIKKMAQYGLETGGKSADLRQRFSAFWKKHCRQSTDVSSKLGGAKSSVFGPTTSVGLDIPTYTGTLPRVFDTSAEGQGMFTLAELGQELSSVREILGLSPNADSRTLRETLAAVVQQTRGTPVSEDSPPFIGAALPPPLFGVQLRPNETEVRAVGRERSLRPTTLEVPRELGMVRTTAKTASSLDCSTVCNVVRKWGLKFDGRRDPVSFLERIEELMVSYSVPPEELIKAMPELLSGSALLWYRNCKDLLHSYDAFRRHFEIQFLPPGYRRNLDEEIRKRTQGEHEPFRDFVIAITTLIRRSGTLSEQGKLDLIYNNMRPEYKLMVRRLDFNTLAEMMERAEDYEAYLREKTSFRPPPPPNVVLVPETAYVHKKKSEKQFDTAAVDKRPREFPREPPKVERQVPIVGSGRRVGHKDNLNRPREERPGATTGGSDSTRSNIRCFRCHEVGHFARGCRRPRAVNCFGCGRPGVTVNQCGCKAGNEAPAQASGGHLGMDTRDGRPPRNGPSGLGK